MKNEKEFVMIRKTILLLCAAISINLAAYAQIAEKEIVAEGVSSGKSQQAREAALNRALRNAVEQAVGTMVDSETLVMNSQLIEDRIYSEAKGYVTSYEVISDNKGEGDVYKITVKANCALGALSENIKALGIIREKLDFPRIIVLMREYIDGMEQPTNIVANDIEKLFMDNKFPVISFDQMEVIKQRDVLAYYAEPKKAQALGGRYGAEVVIVGQATSDLKEIRQPYGVDVFAYEARIEAKAVKVDTAEVIAIDSISEVGRGGGAVPAANTALKAASGKFSKDFMNKIVEAWRSQVYNEMTIQIVCDNANLERANSLEKSLGILDGVKDVHERSFVNDILELDVKFFGGIDQFTTLLQELKKPPLEIIGKTSNRVDVRFAD